MSLRSRVKDAVEGEKLDELEQLVAGESRAVRLLLGYSYQADARFRRTAARGIALAGRHHPRLVRDMMRRLVWAMNDESGTNALTAPEVIQAVADVRPEILLPLVPDLIRLTADGGLKDGLTGALRTIVRECPGKVGQELQEFLNRQIKREGDDDDF